VAIPFGLALQGVALRLQTRPELFTCLLLVVLMLVLTAWSRPGDPDRLRRRDKVTAAGMVLMFVVWANLHRAVVIGWLVLAVTAACELLQTRAGPRSRMLAVLTVLVPAAICINPYGLRYWEAYLPVARSEFATSIQEWVPVWKAPLLPDAMLIALGAIVPLAVAAWALNPDRRWAQLGWLLLVGGLFAGARRNVWPFTLTALLVLAANAGAIDPAGLWRRLAAWRARCEIPVLPLLRWGVRAGVLVWLLFACWLAADEVRPWRPRYPDKLDRGIAQFLTDHPVEARVFNDYENSSYLQWRLAGRPALYLDLLNAYPDRVMRDYLEIAGLTNRGRALLDEQGIGLVVLTTNRGGSPPLTPLATHLDQDPRWVRVYADVDGVIWVRRTPEYESLWRPRLGQVKSVAFAILERWGRDEAVLVPGVDSVN
jgi:hypothetical protein